MTLTDHSDALRARVLWVLTMAGLHVEADEHTRQVWQTLDLPAQDEIVSPDQLAQLAAECARGLGLTAGDSPLVRPLQEPEAAVQAGTAANLAVAESWLALSEVPGDCCKGLSEPTAPFSAKERLPPALMPLSAMNALFLETQNFNARAKAERRRFFDFVEARCTDETYQRVQEKYLNFRALHCLSHLTHSDASGFDFSPAEKYLHLPYWANSKFGIAKRLGLDKSPPLNILDLGSGSGHFGLVSEYFGHLYEGLDTNAPPPTPFTMGDIYTDLFASFRMPRLTQKVKAHEPLHVSKRYDMLTCLMTCFNVVRVEYGQLQIWGWQEWRYFLHHVVNDVLTPDYRIFIHLMRQAAPEDLMLEFERHGATVDRQRYWITFVAAQRDKLFQD